MGDSGPGTLGVSGPLYGYGGCTDDSTRVVGIVLMTAVGGVMWLIFTARGGSSPFQLIRMDP